jgi:sulfide:quinone oxidoreductase
MHSRPAPAASGARTRRFARRPHVVVAGGGVAALEACLALRTFAGGAVRITLLAPETHFVHRPATAPDPLDRRSARRLALERFAIDQRVELRRGRLDAVDPQARRAYGSAGTLPYDALVVAVGARPQPAPGEALQAGRDAAELRRLLEQLRDGDVTSVAFVAPPGPAWRLELYELALEAAVEARAAGADPQLFAVTAEDTPLAVLGARAAFAVGHTLAAHGVRLVAGAYVRGLAAGRLRLSPGDRELAIDRVVAAARLRGPGIPGLPHDSLGFLPVDGHSRVPGAEGVYAAGDCAAFPVKHASLAAEQADAAASAIASAVAGHGTPPAFRPVLRCMLPARLRWYVEAPISGGAGDATRVSAAPLWPSAARFGSRFLSPYLAAHESRPGAAGRGGASVDEVRRAFQRIGGPVAQGIV